MASKVVHLTEAGLQKIKSELEHLRSVERPAISAAIAEARDKGDLSENAEYDAAKEAQGMLEMCRRWWPMPGYSMSRALTPAPYKS